MARFTVLNDALSTLRDWQILLRGLTFQENFRSYEWEGSIGPGKQVRITHGLKRIPTRFVVLFGNVSTIVKGDLPATLDFFYVQNVATSSTFSGKVLILV